MKANPTQLAKPVFQKTEVPYLYRYSSNGVYYALVKHEGKQKRASLEATDKATAKRKLGDFQRDLGKVDPSQGRVTLRELCDRYLLTVQNQAPATVYRKKHIVERLLCNFPGGADAQVSKIRLSSLEARLATYKFGYASQTLYVLLLKALFDLAVNDKMPLDSPAAKLECQKVVQPVRITPSVEEFRAILGEVRKQRFNAEAEDSGDFLEFTGVVGVGQAEAAGLQKQHVSVKKIRTGVFKSLQIMLLNQAAS